MAEQAHNLLPDTLDVDMRGWDDWLRMYGPYFSLSKEENKNGMAAVKAIYESVLRVGMVHPVPDIRAMFEFDSQLNGVAPRNSPLCIFSRIFGNRLELGLLNLDDGTVERLKEESEYV